MGNASVTRVLIRLNANSRIWCNHSFRILSIADHGKPMPPQSALNASSWVINHPVVNAMG